MIINPYEGTVWCAFTLHLERSVPRILGYLAFTPSIRKWAEPVIIKIRNRMSNVHATTPPRVPSTKICFCSRSYSINLSPLPGRPNILRIPTPRGVDSHPPKNAEAKHLSPLTTCIQQYMLFDEMVPTIIAPPVVVLLQPNKHSCVCAAHGTSSSGLPNSNTIMFINERSARSPTARNSGATKNRFTLTDTNSQLWVREL